MTTGSPTRTARKQRLTSAIMLCALLLGLSDWAWAQPADDQLALKVKAAFLFNFAKFVTWPPQKSPAAAAPLQLCVLQPDPFGSVLGETVAGKTIDGHPLQLRVSPRITDLRGCHLIFLGETDSAKLASQLAQLSGNNSLLVYESEDTLANGAIRFENSERRIRFEVNLATTERESLQISSKLLSLATVVRQ